MCSALETSRFWLDRLASKMSLNITCPLKSS